MKILLITNRDSDNLGDQVIEACDISLLTAVMRNLKKQCIIDSRAASIIPAQYLQTKNKDLLIAAEEYIKDADIMVFGGAPMFNYIYQDFYKQTSILLKLASKYNKPVIFSAIGIEKYMDSNKKCQRLKKALHDTCVKQITTRDDFESLQKYMEGSPATIGKVSDPAVFAASVFQKHLTAKHTDGTKKIGIFILRGNGFITNKIPFTKTDAVTLWLDLIQRLDEKGYAYDLITSGHCEDEALLDDMIRHNGVDARRCVFNMDAPEKLVQKIASYDAIVSCRLHPSIIAYALGVPSLGIVWNTKVNGFYENIGYPNRVLHTDGIHGELLMEKLEQVMAEGVTKDEAFVMSVYRTLFDGLKNTLGIDRNLTPYGCQKLLRILHGYYGTSAKEQEEKDTRKFRRIYKTLNNRSRKIEKLNQKITELTEENVRLKTGDSRYPL